MKNKIELSDENQKWISRFTEENKRKPTILHIGNIANNAYNNSKLLIEAGFDSDVICYDYYHTMACPEWEDADFEAVFQNDNRPDWDQVDLGGFDRPRWFAQGMLNTCLRYLTAKRTAMKECEELWLQLRIQSGLSISGAENVSLRASLLTRWLHFRLRLSRISMILLVSEPAVSLQLVIGILTNRLPSIILIPAVGAFLATLSIARILAFPFRKFISKQPDKFEHQVASLLKIWKNEFPDRNDRLQREDLLPYATVVPIWADLLKRYDIVVGYSTDPLLPMLAGVPYFALEHGTIREIPYANTPIGRLCALSYRKAKHIFVTNFDCVNSAQTLAPKRFTVINHPYDEDHGLSIDGAIEARIALQHEISSDLIIFHPTRHDWVQGTGYADKSNDVLIHAFIELRKKGLKIGLVCCTWGKNVGASKHLIETAGLTEHVKWIAPLPITPFERMCRSCDFVADQFMLGAFGGVCFKAMAVGAPIITYLDESLLLNQYSEIPPVINCRHADDVVSKVSMLFDNHEELDRLAEESRRWMKRYHGKAATVNSQIDQFRQHLSSTSAP